MAEWWLVMWLVQWQHSRQSIRCVFDLCFCWFYIGHINLVSCYEFMICFVGLPASNLPNCKPCASITHHLPICWLLLQFKQMKANEGAITQQSTEQAAIASAIQFAFSNSMVPQIKRSLAATNHWMESKWMGNCYFIITIWFKITVINSIQHCLLWRNLRIDCINESKSKQKQWLNGAPVIYLLLLLFDFGVGWFHCCILPANCFVGGKNANGGLYGCLQPNQ